MISMNAFDVNYLATVLKKSSAYELIRNNAELFLLHKGKRKW